LGMMCRSMFRPRGEPFERAVERVQQRKGSHEAVDQPHL